ncbi:RNA polymerase sigma factor [Solirubrobacter ginsenosidimutans]|uniref:RNA polymerase sigma factor n=1 Tax=Solirubrobacter ginsenosidimutans TaxID=490573 RepID=A0A9X3S5S9_9ACTN|nr:RNA polymerase sigma factor [Solirubrobacter ginsenosidimutans]MDA0165917.1 RNA polymerase sigma factor [Solirubrobacter ginsenosidimutans]
MPPAHLRLRSDEHLVSLFRSGREDAFDVLHERHRRRLQATATRALRSSGGDAEGVVQEAFLRAHRALREDRRPLEVKPWLHRVVRNLCIDELRRNRLPTTALEDSDRAGSSEDVYSTLSRRHELRRLIEDLADLPEQQRAALLLRELDGLSHEEVASALDVSEAASRQLVKRARTGLVAAAEARDAECGEIRELLLTAHDERRRPSEHALRHVRGCAACREFRDGLKATRTKLRALIPPVGMGPLAGVLHLVGGATTGGGVAAKVAAGGAVAVLAAGGVAAWQAGEHHVVRGTSPGVEAGGKVLIGKPIRPGTKLPSTVAIASLTVELGDRQVHHAKVTCPPGMRSNGLAQPRTQDGKVATANLRMYNLSDRDIDLLERGTGRRTAVIDYKAKQLPAPLVISVGTLCKRR